MQMIYVINDISAGYNTKYLAVVKKATLNITNRTTNKIALVSFLGGGGGGYWEAQTTVIKSLSAGLDAIYSVSSYLCYRYFGLFMTSYMPDSFMTVISKYLA